MGRVAIANSEELRLLGVLHQVVGGKRGWRWGRVRGWVLGSEVNTLAASSVATHSLHRLRAAGMVDGVTVPDPGRPGRGHVLWRIAQPGEDALAEREGRAPLRIAKPARSRADTGVIFISRDAWAALAVLAAHPGEWVRSAELAAEASHRYAVALYVDDLRMLLTRNLALREERREGRKNVLVYRATEIGLGVRLVDGATNPEIVQVRLPVAGTGA